MNKNKSRLCIIIAVIFTVTIISHNIIIPRLHKYSYAGSRQGEKEINTNINNDNIKGSKDNAGEKVKEVEKGGIYSEGR